MFIVETPDEELTNVRGIDFRYYPAAFSKSPQRMGELRRKIENLFY
jgi:hypothetical protein